MSGYTGRMAFEASTYGEEIAAAARIDARVKIAGLVLFSIGVVVAPWWGVALLAVAVFVIMLVWRLPLGVLNRMLVPVYVMAACSLLFNVIAHPDLGGLQMGAFVAARMIVLVAGSFVICLSTPSSDLLEAFRALIGPLRVVRVPVDDIAFTLVLSLRFIPVIEEELLRVRAAQKARGAEAVGSPMRQLRIWGTAFTSVFVGMFRHADALATAMDARCYGARPARTRLPK